MRLEIESAANFLSNLLRLHSSVLTRDQLELFRESILSLLAGHYESHWFPEKPFKGSAYRCLRINHKMDPIIAKAGNTCGLNEGSLRGVLPNELTLWVDPKEVSYRIGENGSICVLFDGAKEDSSPNSSAKKAPATPVTSPVKGSSSSPVQVVKSPVVMEKARAGSPSGSLSSSSTRSSLSSSPSPSSSPDWCRSPDGGSSPYAQSPPGLLSLPPNGLRSPPGTPAASPLNYRDQQAAAAAAAFMQGPNSAAVAASLFNANAAAQRMAALNGGHWPWAPQSRMEAAAAANYALYHHHQQQQMQYGYPAGRRGQTNGGGSRGVGHQVQVQAPQQQQQQAPHQQPPVQQQGYGWESFMDRTMTTSSRHHSHLNANLEQLAAYVSS